MSMGVDMTRHYHLAGNINDVVGLLCGDVFGHQGDLAMPNPNVESTIDAVCRVDYATTLEHRIKML
jgi:hypothetical protein